MTGRAPDTPSSVKAALAASGLSPLHRFGQNFLVEPGLLDRIAALSGVGPGDVVLEVGPGLGGLTERLLDAGALIVAVEIDHGLARRLRETFAGEPRLRLIEGDVLAGGRALDPRIGPALEAAKRETGAAGWSVAANLPYGVTSPFLLALLGPPGPPRRITVMVQREVGDVLLARPGSDDYGTLSVASATYWRATRALAVGREAFYPRPDVASAVMTLEPREGDAPPPGPFLDFVRGLFQSRRKALRSSLRRMLGDDARVDAVLAAAGTAPEARADGVPPETLAALFRASNSGV
ncbi:MAG TPA: 16S rRNA (adenine(1518)-N(6)/adenine(1519)-N(6))-dimethyltransferase RsmA [Planctomycetota bacterium]|nr:16S rRNA (adenine(1518)-N(6)/adenine(1519)-N(6))-dimethyltransferase RsmA [Planctomycetota bacterium]